MTPYGVRRVSGRAPPWARGGARFRESRRPFGPRGGEGPGPRGLALGGPARRPAWGVQRPRGRFGRRAGPGAGGATSRSTPWEAAPTGAGLLARAGARRPPLGPLPGLMTGHLLSAAGAPGRMGEAGPPPLALSIQHRRPAPCARPARPLLSSQDKVSIQQALARENRHLPPPPPIRAPPARRPAAARKL